MTWAAESRSPDGNWVATAQTREHGGFGTGGAETTVEIYRSGSSRSRQLVLGFADGGRDIALKLGWDGPRHLIATYAGNPDLLYFEVVKTSGIDISVENASPNPSQEYHPSARP